MFDIFNENEKKDTAKQRDTLIKITSLLVHAAKIDEHYSDKEKIIIINFLKSIDPEINHESLLKSAEENEESSNQILKYTQEVKKNTLEFRKKIIKILWKIILSDDKSDMYENTLMRRMAGLLYVPDKVIGEAKIDVLKQKKYDLYC